MSSTTVLQLMQQAMGEIGLTVPTVAVGNTNQDVVQMLSLINGVGYELLRKKDWQALCKTNLFTTSYFSTTGTTTTGSAAITAIALNTASLSTAFQAVGGGLNTNCQIVSVDSPSQVTVTQAASSSNTAEVINFAKTQYPMPADYDRPINSTHWDKTKHWVLLGPETAQQWEWLVSGYIATGPRIRYRIFGNTFQIWPPQTTVTDVLGFEYVSNAWAASTLGVAKGSFTVDTDTCIFDDRLMVLGLKSKYYQAKGLPNSFENEFLAWLDIAKANDAGAATLSLMPKVSTVLIGFNNIPDSGYGL